MTDITDPGSINNGDTPDWDVLQTYFDAIYAVVNNPGQLDNNNIKAAAAISHSKLANATAGYILRANGSGVITAAPATTPVVPAARAASSATTTVPDSTSTAIALAGETYDTDGMHSTSVNTSRMTIVTTGLYRFAGEASFPIHGAVGTPRAIASIRINGSGTLAQNQGDYNTAAVTVNVSGEYTFTAGDYIELVAFHDSAANRACGGKLAISWIGAAS